jgi:nucleoside-diphosphate-sugar epimerase
VVKENNFHKVLVTGATGAIGPRIVQTLHDAGYAVRAFSIDEPQPGFFPTGIDVVKADITDTLSVRSAMLGVETVVHLAALLHVANPTHEIKMEFERVNVRGTATVVNEAAKADVERFVMFSTISVYGNSGGSVLNEETTPRPETLYAQSKRQAEQIVLGACLPDGRPFGTVMRLAAVYGPRVKGNYRRLLQALAKKRFIPIGPGTNRRTLIYDKDVAKAVLAVLISPNAAGKVFNVTDGEIYPLSEIIKTICDALGRKLPRMRLPLAFMRAGADIVDKRARFLGHRSPGFRGALDKYTEDMAVDGHRIQEVIGFKPKYDLLSGWKETIEEMRVRGDL